MSISLQNSYIEYVIESKEGGMYGRMAFLGFTGKLVRTTGQRPSEKGEMIFHIRNGTTKCGPRINPERYKQSKANNSNEGTNEWSNTGHLWAGLHNSRKWCIVLGSKYLHTERTDVLVKCVPTRNSHKSSLEIQTHTLNPDGVLSNEIQFDFIGTDISKLMTSLFRKDFSVWISFLLTRPKQIGTNTMKRKMG